jgi:hypothetical protein
MTSEVKMQKAECKMQNPILTLAFCILTFAFRFVPFVPLCLCISNPDSDFWLRI